MTPHVPHYEFMTPHVPHYEFMTPQVPHYEFMTPMKSLRGRQKSQEVGKRSLLRARAAKE
jgi:hypothetical protein